MAGKKVLISRFTPSLMAPEMLEAIFVQREPIAVDTVDRIRESVLHDNKHYLLFIGPRGCGKTHFVSLIFHRLKRMEDLRADLRVAWLNEDKTSTSVLDLNRRVYETLSADYPDEFPKDQLDAIYDLPSADAATYVQQLLNRRLGDKSALIIVENLDALFENLGRQGQHDWRGFLQESGKFTILATAQQLFPGVSDRSLPFYGFFQTAYLKPLSVQEGRELLKNIATQQEDAELAGFLDTPEGRSRVRTLHHLSGGNHRVYVVFSEFINRKSLDELVTPFEKTLDELTPYYQERLRWLTPQQRMIVEHLCASDRALPVKEIARALFASNQTIAKQLADLKQKRYVQSAKRGRESLYELTEPLMRLAMELKGNRGGPVRLIVDFLRVWYSHEELQTRLRSLPDTERMERIHVESAIAPIDCGAENLRVRALLALPRPQETLDESCRVVDHDPTSVGGWRSKAFVLQELGRYEEALSAIDEAITRAPDRSDLWWWRGGILEEAGRFADAVDACTKGIELNPNDADCFNGRAVSLYALGRYDEALESLTESLRLQPTLPHSHFTRVEILLSSGQWEKGWAEAEKCLQQFPPQTEPTGAERYFIQIIFRSTQRLELWTERIARLCQLFEGANAFAYLGQGLVRTLRTFADDQVSSEVLTRWHSAWHQVGDQYDELGFSLRLFDAGIEYLKTREPNALLDLPLEQRAILAQLFDIDVAHDD